MKTSVFSIPYVPRCFFGTVAAFAFAFAPVSALELGFDESAYQVDPGSTLDLTVAFDQPVPEGLDGYALRISFPEGTISLTEQDIQIVSELDHDLFAEGDAQRSVLDSSAVIRGFADFNDGPYAGTAFVTFAVSIPINAPGGTHSLEVGVADPEGNNFVNGAAEVIDDAITFAPAELHIDVPAPEIVEGPTRDSVTGNIQIQFEGIPGRDYELEASTDLQNWSLLSATTAAQDGTFELDDTQAATFPRRFYRATTD